MTIESFKARLKKLEQEGLGAYVLADDGIIYGINDILANILDIADQELAEPVVTEEMVEAVARAICDEANTHQWLPYGKFFGRQAQAAIQAMQKFMGSASQEATGAEDRAKAHDSALSEPTTKGEVPPRADAESTTDTPGLALTGASMSRLRPGYSADSKAGTVQGLTAGETASHGHPPARPCTSSEVDVPTRKEKDDE